jgi:hypothetical protein
VWRGLQAARDAGALGKPAAPGSERAVPLSAD